MISSFIIIAILTMVAVVFLTIAWRVGKSDNADEAVMWPIPFLIGSVAGAVDILYTTIFVLWVIFH